MAALGILVGTAVVGLLGWVCGQYWGALHSSTLGQGVQRPDRGSQCHTAAAAAVAAAPLAGEIREYSGERVANLWQKLVRNSRSGAFQQVTLRPRGVRMPLSHRAVGTTRAMQDCSLARYSMLQRGTQCSGRETIKGCILWQSRAARVLFCQLTAVTLRA